MPQTKKQKIRRKLKSKQRRKGWAITFVAESRHARLKRRYDASIPYEFPRTGSGARTSSYSW